MNRLLRSGSLAVTALLMRRNLHETEHFEASKKIERRVKRERKKAEKVDD